MARTIRSIVLTSLVLAMLACGLPARTGAPAPSQTDSALANPSSEPAPLPASMSQAVSAGVRAGVWSEAEGLIRSLRYLAGELSAEDVFGDQPLMAAEGTGVVRRAQIYLADPANTEGRDEMTRLMAILVPSRETLDRFSQPASAALRAPGLARPAARPIGDEVLCRSLWSTGFPERIENAAGELVEPVCLEFHEVGIGGRAHRIYLPAYWEEDAPERALFEPTREALERALELYNAYGPESVAGTDIVFTDLPLSDRGRLRDDVLAAADDRLVDTVGDRASDLRCHVAIFPVAVDLAMEEGSAEVGGESYGSFRQTIAHELFHCYQMTNLGLGPRPIAPADSLGADPTEWWVEGSAEYFASVAYPSVNAEFEYLDDLDTASPNTSLIFYSYPAYAFFEYLDAQGGMTPEGIVDGVLRHLPVAGGYDEQQAAAAGLPGMTETFHSFGQAYLDKQLQDLGGGTLPLHPQEGEVSSFAVGPGRAHYTIDPLVLHRYRLNFADHARFTVASEERGISRNSARPASAPGAWSGIPARVNTACGDSEFVLLVTSVVPPGGEEVALDLETSGEQIEEDQPCDECVVGSWVLDNSSYLARMGDLWPFVVGLMPSFGLDSAGAEVHPTGVSGAMVLTFDGDGAVKGELVDWGIAGEGMKDGVAIHASMAYNGADEAAWRIVDDEINDQRILFFDDGSFEVLAQMTVEGFPLATRPTGGSNDPIFLSTPQPFLCTDTTLTYYADDPLGPVVFHRAAPESSAP